VYKVANLNHQKKWVEWNNQLAYKTRLDQLIALHLHWSLISGEFCPFLFLGMYTKELWRLKTAPSAWQVPHVSWKKTKTLQKQQQKGYKKNTGVVSLLEKERNWQKKISVRVTTEYRNSKRVYVMWEDMIDYQ